MSETNDTAERLTRAERGDLQSSDLTLTLPARLWAAPSVIVCDLEALGAYVIIAAFAIDRNATWVPDATARRILPGTPRHTEFLLDELAHVGLIARTADGITILPIDTSELTE